MTTVRPFGAQGGYTELNNYIFDYIMPKLSPNAWKVLCFVIRKTKGWHKKEDSLSLSQIMDGTGIKNRTTVNGAVKELEDGNYIKVVHTKDGVSSNIYALNLDLEIEVGSTEIVLPSTETVLPKAEKEPVPSTKTVPGVVQKSDSQNKDSLSKKVTPKIELERLIVVEISKTCGYGDQYITPAIGKKIRLLKEQLLAWSATPELVKEFREKYWWGKTPPTPTQIADEWGKFMSQRNGSPSTPVNGPTRQPKLSAPIDLERLKKLQQEEL